MGYARRIGWAGVALAITLAIGHMAQPDSHPSARPAGTPLVAVRRLDSNDILDVLMDFLAGVRNGIAPVVFNRTPVAIPQQVSVPQDGTVGPIRFDASDPTATG